MIYEAFFLCTQLSCCI